MEGQSARIAPASLHSGDATVDQLRSRLDLLPDMDDDLTVMLMLLALGQRAGLREAKRGLHWVVKAKGKTHVGWTLCTVTQSKVLRIEQRDYNLALATALKMTRCTCGHGSQAMCPQHGDKMHSPWVASYHV